MGQWWSWEIAAGMAGAKQALPFFSSCNFLL